MNAASKAKCFSSSGTIPEDDVTPLQEIGIHGVFPVGSFTSDMIDFIYANYRRDG